MKKVEFYGLDESDLTSIIDKMKRCLDKEVREGNKLFFDLTGGESLLLVAFGVLSRDYHVPMHMYDIKKISCLNMR